ncbi:hypothetical protein AAFF_G00352830 [Aldrovandia affinis]|uniref:C2H2-type domain-containing protein n=1 Tax=Aldrovandia affinis TaxID=143900 RepID=A0AAD7WNF3_9TELE|nr:hypothetical protein AAFF_G00352830 [Aldrovandia affinis]
MDSDSVVSADHSISTDILLEKIVSGNTIEITDVSLETEGLYHCEKCRQNFSDSNLFSSHPCLVSPSTSCTPYILTSGEGTAKTQSDLYKCPLCDETFSLPSTLKRHFRNHPVEPKGPVNCPELGCKFSGADPKEYQMHLRTVHSLKLVPCAFHSCRLAFRTEEEMEQHRRNHSPFHCTQCDFDTANAKQFGEHSRGNHHPGIGDERRKGDGIGKMEAHSKGEESFGDRLCAPRRRGRPQTHTPVIADEESQEEEEDEEEEEEEQHSNNNASEEKQRDEAATTADPKDHHSKCHIAEGTEHMYRTHICPECRRCFKKRTHLLEHMHLHFPDPSLQCPTCQHYFTSKSKLRIHMLREAGKKLHQCHLCEYSAVERNSLRRHLASIHGEEVEDNFYSDVYPCPTCGKGFRLSQALKAHMKSHHTSPDGKPLVCFQEGCSFQSTDKKELQRHVADAHGVKAVECRHHACSAFLGSQEAMEAHHRTHLAFHCPQCDFSCSNKNSFQRHKRQGHPGTEELHCNFCPFTTFNPVEFDEHVGRLHANEKIHHCLQCNFVTAHKRVLGRHMLLHTGEKPHKCKVCNFRCRDETYLSKHMLTHSDDKNHMCSECGYVTKWKHYLNVHMRKHAGDLRYQCNQCSYRCHRADQLSSHKLRHQEKSLICEVCAFSCKRKYELRKHMQLKHSQGGEYQLPVFQCKYCTYHTQYRQALHNHENCKHTRHREFHCALCSYSTFSSTSLFLHKRKVHGYVPGDKEWLENYAERERENNASVMSQSFCQKQVLCSEKSRSSSGDHTESTGGDSNQQVGASQKRDGRNCLFETADITAAADQEHCNVEALTKTDGMYSEDCSSEKQGNFDTVNQEASVVEIQTNHESVDEQEECCTLVLTPLTSAECADAVCMQSGTENGDKTTLERLPVDTKLFPSQRGTDAEEDDVSVADCEEQSGEESAVPPSEVSSKGRAQAGDMAQGTALSSTSGEEVRLPSGHSEVNVAEEPSQSLLKALKKQDKEQAEALVLEGRVQMLVVQTKACIYRCDRCSYVTRKQTSLSQHCRSACKARRTALRCEDCGAEFKQQRGLDTHRLRKCPVILKKTRRFPRPTTVCLSRDGDPTNDHSRSVPQGETVAENNQSGSAPQCNSVAVGSPVLSQLAREEETASCSTEIRNTPVKERCESAMPERHNVKGRVITKNKADSLKAKESDSATMSSTTEGTLRYVKEGGKFKCKKCSFNSGRLTTIERHCTACTVQTSTWRSAKNSKHREETKTVEPEEDTDSDDDYGDVEAGEEGEEDMDEIAKETKSASRFTCPSCRFVCHQKRALDSHRKRGCLKDNDIQCQLCSFVAKSQEALKRHVLVHGKKKPLLVAQGKKTRLQCELCSFTCKQARCLRQHVALKHEGVKPHTCRFCAFSTTRRYRLEAHESLHTGVGRHSCELCNQTFGTTSKLRLHRQRVHDKRPTHFCSLCDYSGYSLNDVSRHNLSCHTGELCHACALCHARFSSDTALKQHCLRQHQEPTSLPCPSCSFTCRSQATLKAHVLRDHPQLECPTCQVTFKTREALEEHRKTHFTQRCPVCPFAARERQVLAQHLLDEHEDGLPEEKPLKCAVCGFSCHHQLVFEQHVRSHGGARIYKCTDCQYSTGNRQKITWHIRIHTGEKPYRCEKCSYACADPSRLKYHMRIHQEERKYLCPECGYKCKWVNQLKYHMTKHTGAKPYACEECEYRTNRADALRIHRETRHREVRSFICEKCGKGFKTRFLLKTHQKKHSEERPYVCRLCRRGFRWPAGLRHHYLTHTQKHPFHCLYCSYCAKQKFQVVKHLQRHHPDQSVEQGVGKDPGPHTVSLQEARLGVLEEGAGETVQELVQEMAEISQREGQGQGQ